MKKALIVLMTMITLVSTVASAEVDVKALSTDELIALRVAIVDELIARDEMKEVNVPAGEYIVGEDIPAGSYSISTNQILVTIVIGNYGEMYIVTPDSPVGKVTLKAGDTIKLTANVVFTKFAGLAF